MIAVQLVAGLVLLILGGDILVRFATRLADDLGISPLLIGLTVVAMGGSMPELVTTVDAALLGAPGIAIGNIIGSNIANSLLILGAAAILSPIKISGSSAIWRDGAVMIGLTITLIALSLYGVITRITGVGLIAALVGYIFWAYRSEAAPGGDDCPKPAVEAAAVIKPVILIIVGLAVTIFGAHLLVLGAVDLARMLAVSETVIGLSVIAFGTSLPELTTSIIAALKRQGGLVIGNVIGSNIYNIAGILGITALIAPFEVPQSLNLIDLGFLLGAALVFVLFLFTGRRVARVEGAALLLGYGGFLWMLVIHP